MKTIITNKIEETAKVRVLQNKGYISEDIEVVTSYIPKNLKGEVVQIGNKFDNITSVSDLTEALSVFNETDVNIDFSEIEDEIEVILYEEEV